MGDGVIVVVAGLAESEAIAAGVGPGVSGVTGVAAAPVSVSEGVVGPDADVPVGDIAAAWPLPDVDVCVDPSGEVLVLGLAPPGPPPLCGGRGAT